MWECVLLYVLLLTTTVLSATKPCKSLENFCTRACVFISYIIHALNKVQKNEQLSSINSSSVHRDLGWEPEGRLFKSPSGPNRECGLVAGEVPVHLLGTAEVPLSKAPNPPTTRGAWPRQPPHSDISPLCACIGPVCACVCVSIGPVS